MRRTVHAVPSSLAAVARRALPALAALTLGTTAQAQYAVYGLSRDATGAQQLVRFNSATPGVVTTIGATGASLTGIDFRPLDGSLYGYDGGRLFTIDRMTGAATEVGPVATVGGNVGFDFNPTVDRIRLTDGASNFRLNQTAMPPATIVDGTYAYAAGDVNEGLTPRLTGVAYTNSDTDPTTMTTLYGIDAARGTLALISSPNGGTIATVGSLGIGPITELVGFDVFTMNGNFAYFAAQLAQGEASRFFALDLSTGAATLVGTVGASAAIEGIAISAVPEPGTWALLATGLVGVAGVARRRRARG